MQDDLGCACGMVAALVVYACVILFVAKFATFQLAIGALLVILFEKAAVEIADSTLDSAFET